jgi:phospholipid/cholesterol/gamma-HCH transport system permease protein
VSGELATVRVGDTIWIHLGGTWRGEAEPLPHDLVRALDTAGIHRIAFDCARLEGWDRTLVGFVLGVFRAAATRSLAVDRGGLPDELRRLAALAQVVPEGAASQPAHARAWLARIGGATLTSVHGIGSRLAFLGETTRATSRIVLGRERWPRGDFVLAMQAAGPETLPIIAVVHTLLGVFLALVAALTLRRVGAGGYVPDLVATALVRELGPILTAIVVAARSGATFAAELGSLRAAGEDAAFYARVLPRVLALAITVPLLSVYANLFGVAAGSLVSALTLDLDVAQVWHHLRDALSLTILAVGMVKTFVFGALVALSGCRAGLRHGGTAREVGRASSDALIGAIIWVLIADVAFAIAQQVLGV